jgi:hypothetical protein
MLGDCPPLPAPGDAPPLPAADAELDGRLEPLLHATRLTQLESRKK